MIWLVGSLAYAVVALIAARMIAGHLAWRMFNVDRAKGYSSRCLESPTGDQWFGAWCLALCLAVVWPLVVVAMLAPWRMGAEREAQIAARERRVGELERELGIR